MSAFLKSRTLWGALILLINSGLRQAGVQLTDAELQNGVQLLIDAGAFAMVIIGRIRAKGPLA